MRYNRYFITDIVEMVCTMFRLLVLVIRHKLGGDIRYLWLS